MCKGVKSDDFISSEYNVKLLIVSLISFNSYVLAYCS